ncbi:MAG: SsrA-binding protein [Candidatus Staskawiczbacteria bacterium RIFOXYB2_FULL_32_9]|uniref:SsrA-binding protein n=1 Tax=Candidatus Staskawiczbacteria bacterium RIFOXYD1_FULL_32_13 TaxID=1802234 RepID=A0A1G2JNI9_9BACT|nr:MAG: SsrA-binding protein [Parcubacteria group bacterium GW2011_GWC2_32_10]OGZ77619.1 MAG: SsrA-binding protein [Candidatus Staskawiczbacteria bacterium RIFOXYA2_FULL_32_7]OGZ78116.1 MAG: SsrA-binding protein [Candidatus Staskawiczbacteria bacterium RIFOXYB1_FULL_32_11]OGZ82014.1 MAG: SsrA-binding protein [Candidatus Staskawiczbacteria bacterium RIFOXYB2_FULL_32_9]OGZ86855.1 MAG: SsrA-binding protein [Candidatus Staskawiczbacteria bacterium RIFOXYC2_FULL_32_10]OGZ88707.1 MAG: SsrA-binding p
MKDQIYSENKKAYFDYEIIEKFEAGLVLLGQEVKSIRGGHITLTGSYVVFNSKQEPGLIGTKIPPYQPNNTPVDYNIERTRKVLLNKKEINYLQSRSKEKGFSLIPLKVYDNSGRIKLEFALARGKKKYDKKEKIKSRDIDREVNRELSK